MSDFGDNDPYYNDNNDDDDDDHTKPPPKKRQRTSTTGSLASPTSLSSPTKKHNKSGMETLAILDNSDDKINTWASNLFGSPKKYFVDAAPTECLIPDSPCFHLKGEDGRLSIKGVKVCYGYQLVAYCKFGRDELSKVASSKTNQECLVISHLCGSRNCCNKDHLVLESKRVNDERTNCHGCIRSILDLKGPKGYPEALETFFQLGACKHMHEGSSVKGCCKTNKTSWTHDPLQLPQGQTTITSFFKKKQ